MANLTRNILNSFESHAFEKISAAISAIAADVAADIYVFSLLVFDVDDDPRRPMVQLGYNTRERMRDCTPVDDVAIGWPIASDAAEAKWNFSFYLQNQLLFLGEPATATGDLLEHLLKSEGIWYSDEDIERDEERTYELDTLISARFVSMLVEVVQKLHASGVIVRRFGQAIPVLVHELEYYDAIARQNELANPNGLAHEFVHWIDDMQTHSQVT